MMNGKIYDGHVKLAIYKKSCTLDQGGVITPFSLKNLDRNNIFFKSFII